jgi:predicted esterase
MLAFAVNAALFLGLATSAPPVATTSIPLGKGRACTAFLFASAEAKGLPVLLEMAGTGEYHMGGGPQNNPMAAGLVAKSGLAFLTFNKPGVTTDDAAPNGFRIDDSVYNQYTPKELVSCAVGALAWASKDPHVGATSPVVVHGHSEGAIIATHALLRLTETKDPLATRVSAVLLSGTPGGAMKDIVKAQADKHNEWPAHTAALEKNDDAFFRKNGGVGAGTMRALVDVPPLTETFASLAEAGTKTRIALFHGRSDTAVPVEMAEALYAENRARSVEGQRVLDLSLREYIGGHSLNAGAFHDMSLWLSDAIRPDGYLATAERPAEPRPSITLDDKSIIALVGKYKINDAMLLDITREGTKLFAQATGQGKFPLFAANKDLLFATVAPIELKVEREGAAVKAVILVQGGETRCPRVP